MLQICQVKKAYQSHFKQSKVKYHKWRSKVAQRGSQVKIRCLAERIEELNVSDLEFLTTLNLCNNKK